MNSWQQGLFNIDPSTGALTLGAAFTGTSGVFSGTVDVNRLSADTFRSFSASVSCPHATWTNIYTVADEMAMYIYFGRTYGTPYWASGVFVSNNYSSGSLKLTQWQSSTLTFRASGLNVQARQGQGSTLTCAIYGIKIN